MKYIKINELETGMIAAKFVHTKNNVLLLAGNQTLTRARINALKNLDIEGIHVYSNEMMDLFEATTWKANAIVNHVLADESNKEILETLKKSHAEVFIHSLEVSVLSALLGLQLNLDEDELNKLVLASILHDVGKIKVPSKILNKPGKLSKEERVEIEKHAYYGYKMVKEITGDDTIARIVLEHHEHVDGTGYLFQKKGGEIHLYAKIIHIADVYQALIAKRVYKPAMNPADVLDYMYSNVDTMFDYELVKLLPSCVCLYPVGTQLELSNRKKAVVVKYNALFPTRPHIVFHYNNEIVSLKNVLNITITNLITK